MVSVRATPKAMASRASTFARVVEDAGARSSGAAAENRADDVMGETPMLLESGEHGRRLCGAGVREVRHCRGGFRGGRGGAGGGILRHVKQEGDPAEEEQGDGGGGGRREKHSVGDAREANVADG